MLKFDGGEDPNTGKHYLNIVGELNQTIQGHTLKVGLEPVLWDDGRTPLSLVFPRDMDGKKFSTTWCLDNLPQGLYLFYVEIDYGNNQWIRVRQTDARYFLKGISTLKDNYSQPVSTDNIITPAILDTEGQQVTEITVAAGSSVTLRAEGYSGHTFATPCLNTSLATVSLSGTTLTVTGVSEGTTYFGVYDLQNKLMAVAKVTVKPGSGNHEWVDLGLPSGTLWATCNVGASSPEEFGGYYTFDEAQEFNPPTLDQIQELLDNTTSEWTTLNGVNGRKFTGSNGGNIFLPAAGVSWDGELDDVGSDGYYWSSTPHDEVFAFGLFFYSEIAYWYSVYRFYQSVRPVR